MAIAGATTALVAPPLVPVALAGSTAPDWLEWLLELTGHKVKHRGPTHYLLAWSVALAFFLGLWDFHGIGAAFAYGGLTHILADSLTVSGVPFAPHSDRRFHLFGGRLRTGGAGEYGIAWGLVGICLLLAVLITPVSDSWYPFFYNWGGLYNEGLIDGKEWKDNRFRLL